MSKEINAETVAASIEALKHIEPMSPAEIRCGDIKRFKKYLEEQGVVKKPFKNLGSLYGVDVFEDKHMPEKHVAAFVDGKLVSLMEI